MTSEKINWELTPAEKTIIQDFRSQLPEGNLKRFDETIEQIKSSINISLHPLSDRSNSAALLTGAAKNIKILQIPGLMDLARSRISPEEEALAFNKALEIVSIYERHGNRAYILSIRNALPENLREEFVFLVKNLIKNDTITGFLGAPSGNVSTERLRSENVQILQPQKLLNKMADILRHMDCCSEISPDKITTKTQDAAKSVISTCNALAQENGCVVILGR